MHRASAQPGRLQPLRRREAGPSIAHLPAPIRVDDETESVREGSQHGLHAVRTPRHLASCHRLRRATEAPIEFLDITDDVAAIVRAAGLRDGIVTIFSRHTTAAVRIQEDEPLLLEDLQAFLERWAPSHADYRHNDFQIRTAHMHPDESPNGHSHCLHLVLGTSETVPVVDGELQLGTWQRLFLVELDGPRPGREVLVQLLGLVE
jgi:secondary thiamine-phosphate synthase enzyme